MERARKLISAALACVLVFPAVILPGLPCGPFFEEAFFSYSLHPDFPLSKFADGELGIIKPTYARSYLVAAYRYLTGKPIRSEEKKGFEELWQYRLMDPAVQFDSSSDTVSGKTADPISCWTEARAEISSSPIEKIDSYRPVTGGQNDYNTFENCLHQSFVSAVDTLKKYEIKYGKQSPYVKEWVSGQDKVFCHCNAGKYNYKTKQNTPEGPFPEPLPANEDQHLRADRDYQIASAHFYAMQYDQAAKEFQAIAQDNDSDWKDLGLYLAARCFIRKGTIPDNPDIATLSKAASLLQAIIKEKQLTKMHDAAEQLFDLVSSRIQPDEVLLTRARQVLDPAESKFLFRNLYDYTFLLDQYSPDQSGSPSAKPKCIKDKISVDDLTDWILTFQNTDEGAGKHALTKWRQLRSLPWLVSALEKANHIGVDDHDLIEASEAINVSSPAYASVSYYLVKLLLRQNQIIGANQRLRSVLALNLPPSARNDFLTLQMATSSTLKDFINLAAQHPVGLFVDDTGSEYPYEIKQLLAMSTYPKPAASCYISDATRVLNKEVPLKVLIEAAKLPGSSNALRFDLLKAVWTRAVLLDRHDLALTLVGQMRKLRPKLGSLLDAYTNAANPAERSFSAYFLIAKNPGMSPYVRSGAMRQVDLSKIEDYGDNWWGAKGFAGDENLSDSQPAKTLSPLPPFLKSAELDAAAKELAVLRNLGGAPDILATNILKYAKDHPGDSRVPEALHRCVKATRFGSTGVKTTNYSKQAFQLLHRRYSASPWSEQTPYYY